MSGMSSRFSVAGYEIPKYMIEIDGKRVIEHIVNLYPPDSEFVFIVNDKAEIIEPVSIFSNDIFGMEIGGKRVYECLYKNIDNVSK